jgi:hypothetical protein
MIHYFTNFKGVMSGLFILQSLIEIGMTEIEQHLKFLFHLFHRVNEAIDE